MFILGSQYREFIEKMAFAPAKFIREVRAEVKKVIWPTRKEVIISTIMVLILSAIFGLFIFLVDSILAYATGFIIG